MLRFGSAASRSLRTQSGLLKTFSPSVQASHNSTLRAPSYDWVSNNTEFKFNQDKSEQEFESVLSEIKDRLRRVQVPHSARPYVFRPKNAQMLKSIHLTDKNGDPYKSEVWKGPPSSKQLMKLIRRVTSPETADIAQEILNLYIKHYPAEVKSIHLSTFLRTAARAGSFYKVLDLIQLPKFQSLIDGDVAKEAVRLYSIRAVTLDKASAYKDLTKVLAKFSKYTDGSIEKQLDTQLLMAYGLAPSKDQTLITPHLASIKQLLGSEEVIPADAKLAKFHGIQYYYMNLVLGRLGLNTLPQELTTGLDSGKLDQLISSIELVFTANNMKSPLERYVKHASQGIQSETEKTRSLLSEAEAEIADKEE